MVYRNPYDGYSEGEYGGYSEGYGEQGQQGEQYYTTQAQVRGCPVLGAQWMMNMLRLGDSAIVR